MTSSTTTLTISTVLFDADGVLQRTTPGWRESILSHLGSRAEAEGDNFLYEMFVTEAPTMTGTTDFGDSLQLLLDRYGIEATVDEVLEPSTRIETDPGMLAAVGELRAAGIRCCLATNQQTRRAAHMQEHLAYQQIFDEQFYSCELGLAKPDPAYFTEICSRLGVDPATVLFVDDREDNVEAARTVGLHAEVFPRDAGRTVLEELLRPYGLL